MSRVDELNNLIPEDSRELVKEVVNEIIFLEGKLEELKKLPFIEVNHKDASKQRNTPASKLYKEFFQQYINAIKVIESVIYRDKKIDAEELEESPLRKWFNSYDNDNK